MSKPRVVARVLLPAGLLLVCFTGWRVFSQAAIGPTVEFVAPDDGAEARPSSEVTISVDVRDSDGVRSVELYWGKLNEYWPCENVPERRCTRQGNRYTWRIEIGAQTVERLFHVRAIDNAGNRTVSPSRGVRVTAQPTGITLALVSPARGETLSVGEPLTFAAQASAATGEVTAVRVRMLVDPIRSEERVS